jgi:hypothetical protein
VRDIVCIQQILQECGSLIGKPEGKRQLERREMVSAVVCVCVCVCV